jgi:hypothetical protein
MREEVAGFYTIVQLKDMKPLGWVTGAQFSIDTRVEPKGNPAETT